MKKEKKASSRMLKGINEGTAARRMLSSMNTHAKKIKKRAK